MLILIAIKVVQCYNIVNQQGRDVEKRQIIAGLEFCRSSSVKYDKRIRKRGACRQQAESGLSGLDP